jgi:arginine:agmatine antiporter
MWIVVGVNLLGVKEAGLVASLTTYSKLVPFGAIAVVGLFYVRPEHFSTFNPSGQSLWAAGAALAPLTMFAYLGLESATVPAGDVVDPARTIPRSTMLGVGIACLPLRARTTVVLGVVPRDQLCRLGCAVRRCRHAHGSVAAVRPIAVDFFIQAR